MARKNIFEKLQSKWDMAYEANCIYRLIDDEYAFTHHYVNLTLKDYVDGYVFSGWKNRGHYLALDDFLDATSYEALSETAKHNPEDILDFIEIAYNIYYLARISFEASDDTWKYYEAYELFPKIADECLDHFNHKIFYFPELAAS